MELPLVRQLLRTRNDRSHVQPGWMWSHSSEWNGAFSICHQRALGRRLNNSALFATPRRGVKRRVKRENGGLFRDREKTDESQEAANRLDWQPRESPGGDNPRTTGIIVDVMSAPRYASVSVTIMRGNVGSFTVAYAIFFFPRPFKRRPAQSHSITASSRESARLWTRRRTFTLHSCPTLSLIPERTTASFMQRKTMKTFSSPALSTK